MANVRVEVKGGRAVKRALRRKGAEGKRAVGQALFMEGESVMDASKQAVPSDEGTLRASGFVRLPAFKGRGVEVTLGYGGAAEGYAVFLHEGTGPAVGRPAFFPPVQPIAEWADRKGIPIDPFVLARSIGRKGLTPRKFLERPLFEAVPGMDRRLGVRVERALT